MSCLISSTQVTFTCSKSIIEAVEKDVKCVQSCSGVFVYFEHISRLFLVFLVLTLEQINVS